MASSYVQAVTNGISSVASAAGLPGGATSANGFQKAVPATFASSLSPAGGMAFANTVESATDGVMGVVNAWQNKINADYQLSHVPVPYHNISAINSALAMLQPLHTYVIISRPVMLPGYNQQYGHTTGYATIYNGTLSPFSGLTICASCDLSGINATAKEKEMISAALKSGVYL